MAPTGNVQDTHIHERMRALHGALITLVSVMNRPRNDQRLIAAAGVRLDQALFRLLVMIEPLTTAVARRSESWSGPRMVIFSGMLNASTELASPSSCPNAAVMQAPARSAAMPVFPQFQRTCFTYAFLYRAPYAPPKRLAAWPAVA